jgi:protein-S-isoprenylcysteine O-methyltransferase Ste14
MPAPATNSGTGGFAHSRLYDLACAAPLIVVYGFACAGNVILILKQEPSAQDWKAQLTIANQTATLIFFGLQIALCLSRRLPVAKSDGPWPRLVALLGANFNFALLLLPRATLGESWTLISAGLTIGGTLASIAMLAYLGRSFSIFPEARGLVTAGPYRYIRHPLYLAEMVSSLGIMLQFRQPWAALIALVTIAFQIRRMDYEENVLCRTFPDYDRYAARIRRLIPGVY